MRRGARAMLMKRRWLPVLALLAAAGTAQAASLYSGPRAAARPGHPLRRGPHPAAHQAAPWKAKPILVSGATRLPRRRVPLPGLPLRRPRRAPGTVDPARSAHGRRHRSRSRTGPTRTRPMPPTRTTPPTSSSCASGRSRARPRSGVTLNTLKDPSLVAFSIAIGGTQGELRGVPRRRERERARRPVPDRASGGDRHGRPSSRAPRAGDTCGAGPRSRVDTQPPPDRGARAAHAPGTRPARSSGWRPASGLWDSARRAATCCPQPIAPTTPTRRRRQRGQPARVLQRRLPLRRADAPGRATPPATAQSAGLVARPRAGRRAGARATSARSTPTSTSASSPATTRDESGVPQTGADGPHPRQPLRDRAGRRLLRRLLHRRQRHLPGPVPGPPAALRDLRPAQAACRARGYGMTLLLHSLSAQLQPVPRQPQPVAVRRARPGLDRDHARGARPGRLLRQLRRRRRVRGVGRRRAPLQARSRTGP